MCRCQWDLSAPQGQGEIRKASSRSWSEVKRAEHRHDDSGLRGSHGLTQSQVGHILHAWGRGRQVRCASQLMKKAVPESEAVHQLRNEQAWRFLSKVPWECTGF